MEWPRSTLCLFSTAGKRAGAVRFDFDERLLAKAFDELELAPAAFLANGFLRILPTLANSLRRVKPRGR
jgi:hypothetical protein